MATKKKKAKRKAAKKAAKVKEPEQLDLPLEPSTDHEDIPHEDLGGDGLESEETDDLGD